MPRAARPHRLLPCILFLSALCILLAAALPGLAQTPAPEIIELAAPEPPPADLDAAKTDAAHAAALWTVSDPGQGTLLVSSGRPGRYRPIPALDTRVEIRVTGLIARAAVTQRFHNPSAEWIEGVYVFPLPDNAAVDTLRMRIGDRVIEGVIKEREKARKIYEKAKQAGKKASLVEQERPNLFTTSVANLGPDESLEITLEYQQEVTYDLGRFSLRFPMTVTPRFNPSSVPSAARFSPLFLASSRRPSGQIRQPISLRVELDAGLELGRLASPSHALSTTALGDGRYEIELRRDKIPANRDFVLEWEPPPGEAPHAALFTQTVDGEQYALLMVLPPLVEADAIARLPRETLFVLDTSGSMDGASIRQARIALLRALDELRPEDHFNIIEFDNSARRLFQASQPTTGAVLEQARRWVELLEAGGGTNIREALALALEDQQIDLGLRQVIFLTDGAVGNEDELFAYIERHLGRSRLFTVGIGSAPSSYFMREAARFGRGSFTYIGNPNEVESRMVELFAKLESPVMRDLDLAWGDAAAETFPERVGDLYLGEPLQVVARLPRGGGEVRVAGLRLDARWHREFSLADATDVSTTGAAATLGLDKLWARRKIDALLDQRRAQSEDDALRHEIIDLGLRFHLVTPHTSLVAVDRTPTRPRGVDAETRKVPLHPPAGSTMSRPQAAALPQTATPAVLWMLLGLLLLAFGLRCSRPTASI